MPFCNSLENELRTLIHEEIHDYIKRNLKFSLSCNDYCYVLEVLFDGETVCKEYVAK